MRYIPTIYQIPVFTDMPAPCKGISGSGSFITIMMMTGQQIPLPYNPDLSVWKIKQAIQERLQIAPNQQKLLYGDKELKVRAQLIL